MDEQLPDYYEILQVSRSAHPMMITRAFRLLVAFFHPDNKETGNDVSFKQVVESYGVLSDPVRRAAYDRAKFAAAAPGAPGGSSVPALVADGPPADERQIRRLILSALYDIRRSRPYQPMLPMMAIAELLGRTMDEIQFSLWYLRGKKWIEMFDGTDIAITIAGVDEVEASGDYQQPTRTDGPERIPLPEPRSVAEPDTRNGASEAAGAESRYGAAKP